jgi:dolichyl-phosphate-mannose-protein mannosyltransferase
VLYTEFVLIYDICLDVAYGSTLTFKNSGYGGGLLHSHVQRYPSGSEQQQVTCYHYNDNNNDWIITKRRLNGVVPEYEDVPVEYVRDGDVVRLIHAPSRRQLHSHPIKAPVTTSEWEVSAYGDDNVGDENDHWKVEIVDDIIHKDADRIRALTTRFRLRHIQLGCLLMANNVNLPQWGFKQIEVICDKGNKTNSPHAMWNVESNDHPDLEPAPPKAYRSPFFRDFWHLNVAMWTSNNALTPDPDREDTLASEPLDWLTIRLGLRMNGWGDNDIKYYLAGNPVVWWSALATIIGVGAAYAAYIIRRQRQIRDHSPGKVLSQYYNYILDDLLFFS